MTSPDPVLARAQRAACDAMKLPTMRDRSMRTGGIGSQASIRERRYQDADGAWHCRALPLPPWKYTITLPSGREAIRDRKPPHGFPGGVS
jgi:hypothetical protein